MIADLLQPETFQFFAQYLLAGYVVIIVRSRFVAGLRPKPAELIIEAVIFSLWVQLFLVVAAVVLDWFGMGEALAIRFGPEWRVSNGVFLLKVLVAPAVLGAFLGWTLSAGWRNAVLRRLSLPVTHPVETAYDFWFGNQPEPSILLITFTDGTEIAGYFGESSLAASNRELRDIYLEHLYSVGESGELADPEVPRSALVNLADVRSVEILKPEKEQ